MPDVVVNLQKDDGISGGAILQFGNMRLDGSLSDIIRQETIRQKDELEKD